MTDKFEFTEEMRIKFAEADGWERQDCFCNSRGDLKIGVPAYDTHDDLQRVISKLGMPEDMSSGYQRFLHELADILFHANYCPEIDETFLYSDYFMVATVEQKQEAIYRLLSL